MSINTLPPEILRMILFEVVRKENGRPCVTTGCLLLGVCFRWRNLMTTTSEFWTNVSIVFKGNRHATKRSVPTRNPDQVLERLDLQLQRAGSQLIDVNISIDVDADRGRPLFGLILRRAPFHRWRRLEIFDLNWDNYALSISLKSAKFVNLEYIEIHGHCKPHFLDLIDRTATSRLTVFRGNLSFRAMQGYFPNTLPKITELRLGGSNERFSPPPNVVDLTLPYLQLNDLSHIAHLRLTKQQHVGRNFSDYDWANLVSLDFYVTTTYLATSPALQIIFFPRLETLITRGAYYMALAHFSAPRITDLHFDKMHYGTQTAVEGLEQLFSCPFFTLSPSETIDVLFPLNKRTLGNLVRAFPQTKRIKLRFEDEYDRWETTSGMLSDWKNEGGIVIESETDAATSRSAVFMVKFTSLDIQFSGKYREDVREIWRARMVGFLMDTQDTQLKEIRCTWKGELPLQRNRSELKAGDDVSEKVL